MPVSLIPVGAQGIEQDIEEIWRATLKAIQLALEGRDAGQVRAIVVSSQGGAMQLLDARNRPVGRVVSWLDSRGHLEDDRLTRKLGPAWFIEHLRPWAQRLRHRPVAAVCGGNGGPARAARVASGLWGTSSWNGCADAGRRTAPRRP